MSCRALERGNQASLVPNDACALKKKYRLHPDRVIYGIVICEVKDSGSEFALPHVDLTRFFRYKYSDLNVDCHAGHLKGKFRAIFSHITLVVLSVYKRPNAEKPVLSAPM